jgi:hypothetical protein
MKVNIRLEPCSLKVAIIKDIVIRYVMVSVRTILQIGDKGI